MVDRKDNKDRTIIKIVVGSALIGLTIGMMAFSLTKILVGKVPQSQPKAGQVAEKFTVGDQHFLQLTIAVSPEEYIGYDIGDEYEVQK